MTYFTVENTEGFTAAEMATLNARVSQILAEWGASPEDEQAVKTACDRANNEFVRT